MTEKIIVAFLLSIGLTLNLPELSETAKSVVLELFDIARVQDRRFDQIETLQKTLKSLKI